MNIRGLFNAKSILLLKKSSDTIYYIARGDKRINTFFQEY